MDLLAGAESDPFSQILVFFLVASSGRFLSVGNSVNEWDHINQHIDLADRYLVVCCAAFLAFDFGVDI